VRHLLLALRANVLLLAACPALTLGLLAWLPAGHWGRLADLPLWALLTAHLAWDVRGSIDREAERRRVRLARHRRMGRQPNLMAFDHISEN
jgi:hypothetical protein